MPKNTNYPPAPPETDQPWNPKDVVSREEFETFLKKTEMFQPVNIPGYDAEKTQVLIHYDGWFRWIDVPNS